MSRAKWIARIEPRYSSNLDYKASSSTTMDESCTNIHRQNVELFAAERLLANDGAKTVADW
jgi:hypothetical protein